jgi:predicted DNA-binding protein (MmcQ/YjbR family)
MESNLIQRLRAYCRTKPGADETLITFGENRPTYRVLHGFLLSFARFYLDEIPVRLEVRCDDQLLRQMRTAGVSITISERRKWETSGWQWVEVTLDDFATENQLIELIDGSYDLVIGELNEHDHQLINLSAENHGPDDILARLIGLHQLSHHREAIEQLLQNAVLLVTSPADEEKILLGQSRVGGLPDLPTGWAWPTFNGRRLAFLAQVNLAEIEPSIKMQPLPTTGILYFFLYVVKNFGTKTH